MEHENTFIIEEHDSIDQEVYYHYPFSTRAKAEAQAKAWGLDDYTITFDINPDI